MPYDPWSERQRKRLARRRRVALAIYGTIAFFLALGCWCLWDHLSGPKWATGGLLLVIAWWFRREA